MTEAVYTQTAELARSLEARDLGEWSTRLTDAVEEGSTGTEILMRVRWELEQLLASDPGIEDEERTRAQQLIKRITALLVR